MKRCSSCLKKSIFSRFKFKTTKGTIKFKQCKKQIGEYCIVLLLDKIVIRL